MELIFVVLSSSDLQDPAAAPAPQAPPPKKKSFGASLGVPTEKTAGDCTSADKSTKRKKGFINLSLVFACVDAVSD